MCFIKEAAEAHLSDEVFANQAERLLSFENIPWTTVRDLLLDRSDNKSFHLPPPLLAPPHGNRELEKRAGTGRLKSMIGIGASAKKRFE